MVCARLVAKANTAVAKTPRPTKSHTVADPRPRLTHQMLPDPRETHLLRLTSNFSIVAQYQAELRGIAGYDQLAVNLQFRTWWAMSQ